MSTDPEFQWDVFLSHSKADKDVVRDIANRLKSDGVRVWFDDWEIQPGDSIPAKIEDGLEQSRVLVLCMSKAAFGSDWAKLESYSFRFRDPLNEDRRFIPLRLDDAPAKGSLAQFRFIDWRNQDVTAYNELLSCLQAKTTVREDVGRTQVPSDRFFLEAPNVSAPASRTRLLVDPLGKPWHPEEEDNAHAFDYKLNVVNVGNQDYIRDLLRAEKEHPNSTAFTLDWFRSHAEFRKFTHSQSKQGMFIQAGAVVTDGFESGKVTRLLSTYRAPVQFPHPDEARHKVGDSCVFGTVLASFEKQDPHGHVPTALFNDIHHYCPWALFSRKLLLPDIYMDSKFLGIAYNFENRQKRYLFLLWHVRTKRTPEAMRVPARQKKDHDIPIWLSVNEARQLNLSDKPVDCFARDWVLDGYSNASFSNAAFLPIQKFESVYRKDWKPALVIRDEIILDLISMYRLELHFGRRSLSADAVAGEDLVADLRKWLAQRIDTYGMRGRLVPEFKIGHRDESADLLVEILDDSSNVCFRYLLITDIVETNGEFAASEARAKHIAALVAQPDPEKQKYQGIDAVVAMSAVRQPTSVYILQATRTIPSDAIPIHTVEIALSPILKAEADSVVDVAHALLFFCGDDGDPQLVFTERPKDECPRLPGGGVKTGETPQQALLRELEEELGLLSHHLGGMEPLFPGTPVDPPGVAITELSTGRAFERNYRFHPVVVGLTAVGRQHVTDRLDKPDHYPRLADLKVWLKHGTGHGMQYPNKIAPELSPELIERAVKGTL